MQRRQLVQLGIRGAAIGALGLVGCQDLKIALGMAGRAYVFLIRDALPLGIGHIAVGVQGKTGRFTYMSKDGPGHTAHGGLPESGFWVRGGDEPSMLATMRAFGYREYATASVPNADTGGASRAADSAIPGYWLVGDNCLDLTYQTLKGYGARDLPPVQDWQYAFPSRWFDSLPDSWTYGQQA